MVNGSCHWWPWFSLITDSQHTSIQKKQGPTTSVREIHYDNVGLMAWEGIMLHGRTPLHTIERHTIIGVMHSDVVLERYVRLFKECSWSWFYFNEIQRSAALNASVRLFSAKRSYSPDGLANRISRFHPYTACLGHPADGNCNSQNVQRIIKSLKKQWWTNVMNCHTNSWTNLIPEWNYCVWLLYL